MPAEPCFRGEHAFGSAADLTLLDQREQNAPLMRILGGAGWSARSSTLFAKPNVWPCGQLTAVQNCRGTHTHRVASLCKGSCTYGGTSFREVEAMSVGLIETPDPQVPISETHDSHSWDGCVIELRTTTCTSHWYREISAHNAFVAWPMRKRLARL